MRICLLSSCSEPVPVKRWGGIESQVEAQAKGLANAGHEVHVFTVGDETGVAEIDGVTFHRIGVTLPYSLPPFTHLLPGMLRFTRQAYLKCITLRPDIVHLHVRYPAYMWLRLFASARDRWRTVYHAHNWKHAEKMQYNTWRRKLAARVGASIDRAIAKSADHLIAISQFMKDQMVQTSCATGETVTVLTNMIDLDRFQSVPDRHRDLDVLFVGRIAVEKGLLELINELPAVVQRRPDTKLTVVGPAKASTERGSYLRACRSAAQQLGLQDRIEFVGEVPNHQLPDWMGRARVLVVPSIWGEPCGLVAIEGLACGTPVVVHRVGGLPELIEQGRSGYIANAGEAGALTEALLSALHDVEMQQRLAHEGDQIVREHHDWHVLEPILLGVYNGLLRRQQNFELTP